MCVFIEKGLHVLWKYPLSPAYQSIWFPSVSIIFQPCVTCTERVPLALALAFMYNVDMLKERSVKWINKFFLKVWPTKNFASLPPDILQFCLSSAKQDLVCIIRRLKFVTLYEILLRLCASFILWSSMAFLSSVTKTLPTSCYPITMWQIPPKNKQIY